MVMISVEGAGTPGGSVTAGVAGSAVTAASGAPSPLGKGAAPVSTLPVSLATPVAVATAAAWVVFCVAVCVALRLCGGRRVRSCSIVCILSMALLSARGNTGSILPSLVPSSSCPHLRPAELETSAISPRPSCDQIFAVDSGSTGWASAVTMRRASARGVKDRGQARATLARPLFAERPGLVFDDVFIDGADQCPGGFQGARELELLEELVEIRDGFVGELRDGLIAGGAGHARRTDMGLRL